MSQQDSLSRKAKTSDIFSITMWKGSNGKVQKASRQKQINKTANLSVPSFYLIVCMQVQICDHPSCEK